ncbi:GGDEF domain-containing protein [Acidovorax sp.]|uniref:GGDEF domain-containing protein n=1 Tax=Acidovorax sp. TaxID=1872122 RepID=UPI002ACD2CC4|nr:GGDEF domain-containing protein [Acidovorax sp.]MDZ7862255.1 GGDEF domain-containing protein [Acidovorax sp.]
MLDFIFDNGFMPHGYCFLWRKDLLFMMILGNALTVVSYSLIPVALVQLVRKRKDLKFNGVFLLFAAFIAFCGVTHAFEIVNIWNGYYFLQGAAQLITGLVSALTAFVLWRLIPTILAIPSREALNTQNEELRKAHEELAATNLRLEQKVKERTESLQHLANTDPLTKIKNRRAILETLDYEIQRYQRTPHSLSVLMLDIDHFKTINDTFGHLEGDTMLLKVAQVVSGACRQTDSVGRYGGEEFLIVLPETNITDAKDLAERIRLAMKDCPTKTGDALTCSIGVATLTESQEILELIKVADDRVYAAKAQGRNRVVFEG